jgi:hypothetical protein
VKYGTDAYGQWSVDELLTLAKGVGARALKENTHVMRSDVSGGAHQSPPRRGRRYLFSGSAADALDMLYMSAPTRCSV